MPSLQSRFVQIMIRLRMKKRMIDDQEKVVRYARKHFGSERLKQFLTPKGVRLEAVEEANIKGEWVWWEQPPADHAILYLHGGGYIACSPATHRNCTAELARQTGLRVFALDYRLAPEHKFPAQIDDAVSAYHWLRAQGIASHNIVIGGDSAGGGLTMATLIALRDAGESLPAFGFCFSPWVDMTASGASYQTNHRRDPMFYGDSTKSLAPLYLGATAPNHPLASPIFADLTGLPPLSVYVGSTEVLLDDARQLVARAQAHGVTAELHIADRQPHVWPIMVGLMPEATQTIKEVAAKIQQHLQTAQAQPVMAV